MIKQIHKTLDEALPLIKEADILLYRGSDCWFSIGWLIKKYSNSEYSHVALATLDKDIVRGIEFREFQGCRQTELISEVNSGQKIDIYRVASEIVQSYVTPNGNIAKKHSNFSPHVAREITSYAKSLVGKPYGYSIIWHIFKSFIPGYRFLVNKDILENGYKGPFVCSTLASVSYRKHFCDLIPGIADEYTSPGDISRSAVISYLFSIVPN